MPASSDLVFPFPAGQGFTWQRIDAGQDLQTKPGGVVVAISPGNVYPQHDAYSGFGQYYCAEDVHAGPLSGRTVYYGHTKMIRSGNVNAGDVIAVTQTVAGEWTAAPAGWLEIGFTPYGRGNVGGEMAVILQAVARGQGFVPAAGYGPPPPAFHGTDIQNAIQALNWAGWVWNCFKTWEDQAAIGYYGSATAANDILHIDKFVR